VKKIARNLAHTKGWKIRQIILFLPPFVHGNFTQQKGGWGGLRHVTIKGRISRFLAVVFFGSLLPPLCFTARRQIKREEREVPLPIGLNGVIQEIFF
jgi:hypothetical protein